MNIEELFARGGIVVWILAGYSMVGITIILDRYLLFLRQHNLPKGFSLNLNRLLDQADAESQVQDLKGPEARIIQAVVDADRQGVKDLHGVGSRIRSAEMQRLETGLPTLGLLGNTAPLLGLLGTIMGLIEAFTAVANANPAEKADLLSASISVAMNTTAFGLIVAIPCIAFYIILSGMTKKIIDEIDQYSVKLENLLIARGRTDGQAAE